MAVRYVLDTDILSDLQRGNTRVVENVRATEASQIGTTIISAFEELRGRFDQVSRAESQKVPKDVIAAYRRLQDTIEFFRDVQVLGYTLAAEESFAAIRRQTTVQKVKTHDLRIACIALSIGATLVTRNRGDFQAIPNLLLVDWSA